MVHSIASTVPNENACNSMLVFLGTVNNPDTVMGHSDSNPLDPSSLHGILDTVSK